MGPWEELAPGVWRSEYATSMGIVSNGFAIRLHGDELMLVSAPSDADEAAFAATEKLGRPAVLLAQNTGHDLGLKPWKARYPEATVYAPAVSAPAIAKAKGLEVRPVTELLPKLPADVKILDAPGTSSGSALWSVQRGDHRVLFVDEIIGNHDSFKGPFLFKPLMWAMGPWGPFSVSGFWLRIFCKDKKAFVSALLAEADAMKPTMLTFAHGPSTTERPLERLHEKLDAYVR
jgi:hypothetical protein